MLTQRKRNNKEGSLAWARGKLFPADCNGLGRMLHPHRAHLTLWATAAGPGQPPAHLKALTFLCQANLGISHPPARVSWHCFSSSSLVSSSASQAGKAPVIGSGPPQKLRANPMASKRSLRNTHRRTSGLRYRLQSVILLKQLYVIKKNVLKIFPQSLTHTADPGALANSLSGLSAALLSAQRAWTLLPKRGAQPRAVGSPGDGSGTQVPGNGHLCLSQERLLLLLCKTFVATSKIWRIVSNLNIIPTNAKPSRANHHRLKLQAVFVSSNCPTQYQQLNKTRTIAQRSEVILDFTLFYSTADSFPEVKSSSTFGMK